MNELIEESDERKEWGNRIYQIKEGKLILESKKFCKHISCLFSSIQVRYRYPIGVGGIVMKRNMMSLA